MTTTTESGSSKSRVLLEMLLAAFGIYASMFWWSVMQEKVATVPYMVNGVPRKFNFATFIGVIQCSFTVVIGLACFAARRLYHVMSGSTEAGGSPWVSKYSIKSLLLIGLAGAVSAPFGYASMKHLPFPVVLTLKMCKMVPTVIVGFVVYRTRYSMLKYIDILLITTGVIAFMLLDTEKPGKATATTRGAGAESKALQGVIGAALVFTQLTLDGIVNSSQEVMVKRLRMSGFQMMVLTGLSGLLFSIVFLLGMELLPAPVMLLVQDVFQPQLYLALEFVQEQPQILNDVILMCFLCAIGQTFIFMSVELFGTLTATAMTVTRKVGSVALSIFWHGHRVQPTQLTALIAVMAGVALDAYINVVEKGKHKPLSTLTDKVVVAPPRSEGVSVVPLKTQMTAAKQQSKATRVRTTVASATTPASGRVKGDGGKAKKKNGAPASGRVKGGGGKAKKKNGAPASGHGKGGGGKAKKKNRA